MFLKNYYDLMAAFNTANFQTSPTVSLVNTAGSATTVSFFSRNSYNAFVRFAAPYDSTYRTEGSGSLRYITNGTTVYYDSTSNTGYPLWGVIIGDGDTAPAFTDYNLSGNQIVDFSATTSASVSIDLNNHIIAIGTYNITNTGASPFTIKEIGNTIRNNSGDAAVLISRDLLATPVTIAPGNTGVVTYKIEIS